jgi:hypothetical protein
VDRTAPLSTVLFLCIALAVAGCVPPAAQCPQPPASSWQYPPQMPRAGTSSVEIEFSGGYIRQMVLSKIPPALPNDNTGVEVRQVGLEERNPGPGRTNILAVRFAIWGRGQGGEKVFVPGREYTLRLRLTPYLVTPRIVPDEAKRRALLSSPAGKSCDSGIVLGFDFYELAGGPNRTQTEPVDCKSSKYDFLDEQVLQRAFALAAAQSPLPVGMDELVSLLEGIVGSRTFLTGIDLSTDQDLTLALTVDKGTPRPFRPTVARLRTVAGGADWGIWIDRELVTPYIRQAVSDRVAAEAAKKGLTMLQDRTDVTFGSSGIAVDVAGRVKVPLCGDVPVRIQVAAAPSICNRVLGMCVPAPAVAISPVNDAQKICVDGLSLLSDIVSALKSAVNYVATLGQGSPQAAASKPCSRVKEIAIPSGSDVLYGTAIDVDGMFYIAGRSRSMDSMLSRPAPAAASCPWD